MNAEGGAPENRMDIRSCRPPHHLAVTSHYGDERWLLDLDLHEADGVTTLEFSQVCSDPDVAASMGAGWEYYLDRLVAAETGGDVERGGLRPRLLSGDGRSLPRALRLTTVSSGPWRWPRPSRSR